MPIHHAVLGLLADGESYGYELRIAFERAVGPQWGEFSIGHIYQVLERLERDGMVTRRVVPQEGKPNRVVYRITNEGREELRSWLKAPHVREVGYRDDFFLKLFVASRMGARALARVISVQRQAYMGELAALQDLRREHHDDPLIRLLIGAAIEHTRANLTVVDQAEAEAVELVAAGAQDRRAAASRKAARTLSERVG